MLSSPVILVCTDFSIFSDRALCAAGAIAKKTSGRVILLHVAEVGFYVEWGAYGITPRSIQEEFVEILRKDLSKRLQEQLQRCNVEATPVIETAASADQKIMDKLMETKADLLVIGERGNGNRDRFPVGSLARKLVAQAPVPLLVIKQDFKLERVAGLVDQSESMHEVIARAEEIASLFSSQLEIISLWQDVPGLYANTIELPSFFMEMVRKENETVFKKIHSRIEGELKGFQGARINVQASRERKLSDHLLEILSEGNFDLAVMKRHSKNFAQKFFIGSETNRVLEQFPGNLLVCPPEKE